MPKCTTSGIDPLLHMSIGAVQAAGMLPHTEGGMDPCAMGDEAMPDAPDHMGPSLIAFYSFSQPGVYRLLAQGMHQGGHMVVPSWFVEVAAPASQQPATYTAGNGGGMAARPSAIVMLSVAVAALTLISAAL